MCAATRVSRWRCSQPSTAVAIRVPKAMTRSNIGADGLQLGTLSATG